MRLRGFLAGYLGLVAFSALVTERGSRQFTGLLGVAAAGIRRALAPNVAGLRDYRRPAPAMGAAGGPRPTAQQAVAPGDSIPGGRGGT